MKALKAAFADGLRVQIANKDIGAFRTPGQSDDAKKQALKENPNNPRALQVDGIASTTTVSELT